MIDEQLMAAFWYVANETVRIMTTAMKDGKLTKKEWDTVNKLFEVFADGIKDMKEWKENGKD